VSDPTHPHVLFEVSEAVAVLTVARPEKLNALNSDVVAGISAAVSRAGAIAAEREGALRCLIVTGAGDKAFIAGADIGELAKLTPMEGREHARRGQALLDAIERLPVPTIAAINGFAYGGGLELAMACTLRVASENAKMGLPETSLGIIPGYGGTQRLARIVGAAKAYELVLTSEKGLTASEAERIGLVNRVVPAGQALAAAREMAAKIAANGPAACRYALDAIRSGIQMPLADGLLFESTLFGLLAATADMKEGMTAFLEKRPARFTGK
jgi:enoyl-CoA hydratase